MGIRYGGATELAEEVGRSRDAVYKAERVGRITRCANGQFDLDACAMQWKRNTDPEQQRRSLAKNQTQVEVVDRDAPDYGHGGAADLIAAKARREAAEAALAELELAEKRSQIMDVGDHKRVMFALIRAINDALMQIPARTAAQCAASSDQMEVRALLDDEVRKTLEQLQRWRPGNE